MELIINQSLPSPTHPTSLHHQHHNTYRLVLLSSLLCLVLALFNLNKIILCAEDGWQMIRHFVVFFVEN